MSDNIKLEDLPIPDLAQSAFSAYVDAAQATGHAHERLMAGSYAAAESVASDLLNAGWLRRPTYRVAVHGTTGGYHAGCRCAHCSAAARTYERALRDWTRRHGHNKVEGV